MNINNHMTCTTQGSIFYSSEKSLKSDTKCICVSLFLRMVSRIMWDVSNGTPFCLNTRCISPSVVRNAFLYLPVQNRTEGGANSHCRNSSRSISTSRTRFTCGHRRLDCETQRRSRDLWISSTEAFEIEWLWKDRRIASIAGLHGLIG